MSNELPQRTLRLVYAYEGDKITLVSKQSVEMMQPTALQEAEKDESKVSSFSLELRNGADHALLSRSMENPVRSDIEVFSDNPKRSARRVEMPEKKGTFVLLVPDIPQAESLVFLEKKPEKAEAGQIGAKEVGAKTVETKEIARFSLR